MLMHLGLKDKIHFFCEENALKCTDLTIDSKQNSGGTTPEPTPLALCASSRELWPLQYSTPS